MHPDLEKVLHFRDGEKADIAKIMATWLNGLYYGNDWFRQIDRDTYFKKYHDVVTTLLLKPGSCVHVACLKEDHDTIVGYAIYRPHERLEGLILDWVFVNPAWRKQGIAKKLIPNTIVATTHLTKVGRSIKPKNWMFDPFLS